MVDVSWSATSAGDSLFSSGCVEDRPFRHRVIDDWAPAELVRAAEAEWPDANWAFWHRYECGKLATKDVLRLPPACEELTRRMLCIEVEKVIGIPGTFGDWLCHGGGMHESPSGVALGKHLDSDHHPLTGWQRACNAILFINSEWKDDWGGEFELWSNDGAERVKTVKPKFNRLVLFEPTSVAYHSVAKNMGPASRKTLATFFWRSAPVDGPSPSRPRARFV